MKYRYAFLLTNYGTEDEPAYEAIIPAFGNIFVYGNSLEEVEEGIEFAIESSMVELRKKGRSVPVPEGDIEASGRILLRIKPSLHQRLILEAKANQMSLNKYIESKLEG